MLTEQLQIIIANTITKIAMNYNKLSKNQYLPQEPLSEESFCQLQDDLKNHMISDHSKTMIKGILLQQEIRNGPTLEFLTTFIQSTFLHSLSFIVQEENEKTSRHNVGYVEFDDRGRLTNDYIEMVIECCEKDFTYESENKMISDIEAYEESIQKIKTFLSNELNGTQVKMD